MLMDQRGGSRHFARRRQQHHGTGPRSSAWWVTRGERRSRGCFEVSSWKARVASRGISKAGSNDGIPLVPGGAPAAPLADCALQGILLLLSVCTGGTGLRQAHLQDREILRFHRPPLLIVGDWQSPAQDLENSRWLRVTRGRAVCAQEGICRFAVVHYSHNGFFVALMGQLPSAAGESRLPRVWARVVGHTVISHPPVSDACRSLPFGPLSLETLDRPHELIFGGVCHVFVNVGEATLLPTDADRSIDRRIDGKGRTDGRANGRTHGRTGGSVG